MPARHNRSAHRQRLLAERAWQLRSAPTAEEALLGRELRSRQLGVVFRRQVVLARRFIVDFFAPEARLVVEVDAGYHARRRRADARRDRVLAAAGYRVLRLEAELVRCEIAVAVARIRAVLALRH